MPKTGRSSDFDRLIEDLIAEMLTGRDALIQLEAFILANQQYGNLSMEDGHMLLEETDKARRGLQNGLRLGRLVRSPPPDLEGLARIVEDWEVERALGRQAKRPSRCE